MSMSFKVTTPARRLPSVTRRRLDPVWFINDRALIASVSGPMELFPEQGAAMSRTFFTVISLNHREIQEILY